MEFVWLIILVFAIVSKIAENSKKQAQRRSRDSRAAAKKEPEEIKEVLSNRDYPRPEKSDKQKSAAEQSVLDMQEIFELFTGKTAPLTSESTTKPVADQEVIADSGWKNSEDSGYEDEETKNYEVPETEEIRDMTGDEDLSKVSFERPVSRSKGQSVFSDLNEAARGVVWHEILDSPRARSPHVPGRVRK